MEFKRVFRVRAWTLYGALRIIRREVPLGTVYHYTGASFTMIADSYATPVRIGWSKDFNVTVYYRKQK